MGKFSIESVTESLLLKVVKDLFLIQTLRSSSSTILSDFCLFHKLTVFPLLKYLVFLLRHLIGRNEVLMYKLLLKMVLDH